MPDKAFSSLQRFSPGRAPPPPSQPLLRLFPCRTPGKAGQVRPDRVPSPIPWRCGGAVPGRGTRRQEGTSCAQRRALLRRRRGVISPRALEESSAGRSPAGLWRTAALIPKRSRARREGSKGRAASSAAGGNRDGEASGGKLRPAASGRAGGVSHGDGGAAVPEVPERPCGRAAVGSSAVCSAVPAAGRAACRGAGRCREPRRLLGAADRCQRAAVLPR